MRSKRSLTARVVALGAALVSLLFVVAPQPSMAGPGKLPLTVVAKDYRFLGVPSSLPAATYRTTFSNVGDEFHVMLALNLGPTCSALSDRRVIRLVDEILELEDEAAQDAAFADACPGGSFAGAVAAPPGGQDREDLTFTPGRVYYFCPVPTEEGTPHYELGMRGFVDVRSVVR
ncbi:MAG: hypothetical protein ACR2G7_05640 [Acidimicrobiales bacterium]